MRIATHRYRSGLAAALLIGVAASAAGCGGTAAGPAVAGAGATTTAAGPAGAAAVTRADVFRQAQAFAECMRTHGEPGFPAPVRKGNSVQENITAGSGVDPNSPQFTAARNACKHLLPNRGVPGPSPGQTITAAERADYVKAAACMRSHGVPDFPDPTFQGGSVAFNSQASIDTNTPEYESALTRCRKLIPAGLPYSSSSG